MKLVSDERMSDEGLYSSILATLRYNSTEDAINEKS